MDQIDRSIRGAGLGRFPYEFMVNNICVNNIRIGKIRCGDQDVMSQDPELFNSDWGNMANDSNKTHQYLQIVLPSTFLQKR